MEDTVIIDGGASLGLRGVIATLFGIAAVFWPGETLITLLYLFAAFILVNGIIDLVFGLAHIANSKRSILTRFLTLIFGLLQMGVGVYLLRHPHVTFATLILLISFVLIIGGMFRLMESLFEEGPSFHRIVMAIIGLVTILAGILLLFQPASAGVAFVWILGLYALITGPLLIALSFQVNKLEKDARKK